MKGTAFNVGSINDPIRNEHYHGEKYLLMKLIKWLSTTRLRNDASSASSRMDLCFFRPDGEITKGLGLD